MNALETRDLSAGYRLARRRTRSVVSGLDVRVARGRFVCLLGPNGAGKSTLLRTLAGLQQPLAGQVLLDGDDLNGLTAQERAKRAAVVLTERVNPGLLSGWSLVALGRTPHTGFLGTLTAGDERAVFAAVEAVGAVELAARPVVELSDGERQKLLIARALAQDAPVVVLDEPTAFLDATRRVEIMTLLRDLAHDMRRAVIVSTHEIHLANELADAIWLMDGAGGWTAGTPYDLRENGALRAAFPTLRLA